MKLRAMLILFPLAVSLFLPLTAHFSFSSVDNVKYLVALDACGASAPMTQANPETFSLNECACRPVPFESAKYIEPDDLSFAPSLHFVQLEHPPRS